MLIPSQIWGEGFEIDPELVKANLQEIKNKIAHSKVKIIAVTKYFGIDGILYASPISDAVSMIVALALTLSFFKKVFTKEKS